jgi:DNA-binding CsgD family transcriptional regulator
MIYIYRKRALRTFLVIKPYTRFWSFWQTFNLKTYSEAPAAGLKTHADKLAAPPTLGRPKINVERDTAIYLRIIEGESYAAVARSFGVSLVRVGQIVAQQRAMRGISPKANTAKRNEEIIRRLSNGETRQEVAAAHGVSRSVVDNLVAMERAKEYTPKVEPVQVQEVLTLKVSAEVLAEAANTQPEQPTSPPKPRYVMPGLNPSATTATPDTRTALERDVFDPEFGF